MAKSLALIPYRNQSAQEFTKECYDKSLKDFYIKSWNTQFKDLELMDFSDGFGLLKFQYMLGENPLVQKSYIYKISNDKKEFLVLGTCHGLPLKVFPEKLISLLLEADILVSEGVEYQEEQVSENNHVPNQPQTISNSPPIPYYEQEWFENYPRESQLFISWFINREGMDEMVEPLYLFSGIDAVTQRELSAMDNEVINDFSDRSKIIFGLENFAEKMNDVTSLSLEEFNKEVIESGDELLELIKKDQGILGSDAVEVQKYLTGELHPKYDIFTHERTSNWIERINNILDNYPTDVLVACGVEHLFNKGGLIDVYQKLGWNIQEATLTGDFVNLQDQAL